MSKFIYIQDGHLKGRNSVNRLGDYFQDWLIKFDEVISIAQKNDVKDIIDGGDLFDSPVVSYSVCDAVVDRIEKSGLDYYCLFGNHSTRFHSKEHSYDTTLAHILRRSKNFKYLDSPYLKHGKQRGFSIIGIEYSNNIEEEIKENGIMFDDNFNDSWKIAIVHAFVCPKPFPYASHVVCDDIKSNADLILIAHYHSVWEKKVGNTQYLDIGCFGRNSITEASIEPSCVLLDTEKRSYEIIKLKSAKKGEEVFDLTKVKELKEADKNIELFIKSLESASFQQSNIKGMIQEIALKEDIDKSVVNLIIEEMDKIQ